MASATASVSILLGPEADHECRTDVGVRPDADERALDLFRAAAGGSLPIWCGVDRTFSPVWAAISSAIADEATDVGMTAT